MLRISAITLAILGSTALVRADAQPATGPGVSPAPQTASPYWNGQPQQATDLPAADIRAVPAAHANFVRSQLTFNQSLFDLNNAVRLVRMQMDRDPAYVKAQADERAAYDQMDKARTAALASLNNNSAYTGAATLHKNVSDQIEEEKFAVKPDPAKLAAMAKVRLQYVKDNRKLERDALDRDQAYQDARKTYLEAHARVVDYQGAQAIAIAQDDTLTGIRKQVAANRIEKSVSGVYWTDSIAARNIALNYAGFYRGIDRYHGYGNGYGSYGYGYGGGYGYGLPY